MCTIHKSGTQAINFRLSLRRFWRPLQMRKHTMLNIIKVFPQKRCDFPPKLTMDRVPCHKCVIQRQVLLPWQPVPHVKMTSLFVLIYLFETCARSGWPLSTHNLSLYFSDPLFSLDKNISSRVLLILDSDTTFYSWYIFPIVSIVRIRTAN